jgi:hypothetical protein
MDGLHVEGMTEDERDACIGAEVDESVPGEHTFDRDDGTFSIRGNGFQKGLWVRLHVAVQHDLAALVEDADIHSPRVQVDAAVKWVLSRYHLKNRGLKAHALAGGHDGGNLA